MNRTSIDKNDIVKFTQVISKLNDKLQKMVPSIALAKTVIEMSSDRRKKLLADCMVEPLKEGKKGASAENAARSTPEYEEGLKEHAEQLKAAYETDFQWRAYSVRLDSARSLLAISRETLRNFAE